MAFKKIPLTIDTMIRNPVPIEGINQEDNIELNIVVTENKTPKDLSGQTIKVYVRRIDGTLVEQTDQITPTNASKGEVTVKLKNSAFNKEGYALFQLDISDSSGRITSSYATFKIGKGLVSGEVIANTNEIEALKKVEEYIKKANQELETFKQTVAEINENEATRQENEVVRVREEASRNEAEAIRAQQEATRKEKENERVQAEIKRIADEEMRRENEVLRGSKELERKQAEELRKETELLRIEDENNRKVAESERIEAESVRVEAEKLRVAAEIGRVEAESLRVTAEEGRVEAETRREEGFNKFEGKINANTEELKKARSATTGEVFDTLDERIDHEVGRLNKKIEVSMLQQEDKEIHAIENSIEGMTTEMIIKGKTVKLDNGDIESFGFKEGNKISILSNGINLCPQLLNVGYVKPNGDFISSGGNNRISEFVKIKANTSYVFECINQDNTNISDYNLNISWYDINKNFIAQSYTKSRGDAIVSPQNSYYVRIHRDGKPKVFRIQEGLKGSLSNEFIPYQSNKKDILLKNYGFENGFNGINNIYDEFKSIKKEVIKRINKYSHNGTEKITIHTVRNNTISFNYSFIDGTPKGKNSNPNIITNCFETNISCYSNDIEGCFGTPSGFFGSVLKTKLESQDINGITKYVRENFKKCYYELAEPVETPFTENINLKTFGERTYISFENSISGTSSFKAPVNTVATIARLNRENRALEEENKNLRQDFESTTLTLTDSDLELVKQNVDMDFRLMEVEFALDIPQAILSSNINFKNKKGEVKSMARTPYEMMKIVILSGDYDREDYMHKVGKYYERGRMSKEEYDELMSLMTADEVIGG